MKQLKTISVLISILAVVFIFTACGGQGGWGEPSPDTSLAPFNTSTLPLNVTDGTPVFSFAFDNVGNLLFIATDAGELRVMNRDDGAVTTVATGLPGDTWRGIAADGDSIYIGAKSGEIYEVDPATGITTLLTTIAGGGYINCLAIAPSTFGSYAGQLIAASNTGIYAVDQSVASPTAVQIASISNVSSIVFGSDGTLYATDYSNNRIVTVTSTGGISQFATGFSGPDGLAIDNAGGFLYVTNCADSTIKSVTIPGGTVVDVFTGLSFGITWAPSPIIYDAPGDILLVGQGGTLTIDYFDLSP
jgi:hypothetical protein